MVSERLGSADLGRLCLLGAWLLAGLGCQGKEVAYQVRLVTSTCNATAPLEGATFLRFRITGDDMQPMILSSPLDDREVRMPEIPVGSNRVIEVRGYDSDPKGGGKVLSIGKSLPFDVPGQVPEEKPAEISIFLRRVNSFTPPSLSVSPGTCTKMMFERAGHTATLLRDGKVFIAGGYQEKTPGRRNMLAKSELFNPATGAFEEGNDLGVMNQSQLFSPTPRAFHSATLLNNGQVLLAGGEDIGGSGTPYVAKSALVYDPDSKGFGLVLFPQNRTRHQAAKDEAGRVLLIGGVGNDGGTVGPVEWYDPSTGKTQVSLGAPVDRMGHSASAVQGGKYIAVAGGGDGGVLDEQVLFLRLEGNTVTQTASPKPVGYRRRSGALVPFLDGNRLLLVGGYASIDDRGGFTPVRNSEVVATGNSFSVSDGPELAGRGDLCAVSLPGGRALVAGGRSNAEGAVKSVGAAELVSALPSGDIQLVAIPPLPKSRYFHTCTALSDGTVLILGGVNESPTTGTEVLSDALIFTPPPLD